MRLDQQQKLRQFPQELVTRDVLKGAYDAMIEAGRAKSKEVGPGSQGHSEHLMTVLAGVSILFSRVLNGNTNLGALVDLIETQLDSLQGNPEKNFLPVAEAGFTALTELLCQKYDDHQRARGGAAR